jgi:hypothetical protein
MYAVSNWLRRGERLPPFKVGPAEPRLQQWTVPFGGGAGKIVRWGSTPLDLQFQVFYNVIAPDSRGDWGLRLMAKALFIK